MVDAIKPNITSKMRRASEDRVMYLRSRRPARREGSWRKRVWIRSEPDVRIKGCGRRLKRDEPFNAIRHAERERNHSASGLSLRDRELLKVIPEDR